MVKGWLFGFGQVAARIVPLWPAFGFCVRLLIPSTLGFSRFLSRL